MGVYITINPFVDYASGGLAHPTSIKDKFDKGGIMKNNKK